MKIVSDPRYGDNYFELRFDDGRCFCSGSLDFCQENLEKFKRIKPVQLDLFNAYS